MRGKLIKALSKYHIFTWQMPKYNKFDNTLIIKSKERGALTYCCEYAISNLKAILEYSLK